MNLTHILKRPVITEQSMHEATQGVFTFEVVSNANKHQIRNAIEQFYGVDVVSVRTTRIAGNRYRAGKQRQAKVASPVKKARVQLEAGQKIDLFELEEGK